MGALGQLWSHGNQHDDYPADSIIGEGMPPQRFGSIMDSVHDITVARNLWIDNESRNPKLKADGQYVNNVVYDWGNGGGVIGGHSSANWNEDLINNYLIAGPTTVVGFLTFYASTDLVYQTGNLVDVNQDGQLNGRAVVDSDFAYDTTPPTFQTVAYNKPSVPVTIVSAGDAYAQVVAQAGTCQLRDAVETRLVGQLQSLGKTGAIIATTGSEADVGGQPTVAQVTRPAGYDTDGDGMPDTWETAHGLNPNDPTDATGDYNGDGYTNVEKYLNEAADLACPSGASSASDAGIPSIDSGVASGDDAGSQSSADASYPGTDASSLRADASATIADASGVRSDASLAANDAAVSRSDATVSGYDASSSGTEGGGRPPMRLPGSMMLGFWPTVRPRLGRKRVRLGARPVGVMRAKERALRRTRRAPLRALRPESGASSSGCSCATGPGQSKDDLTWVPWTVGLLLLARCLGTGRRRRS